MSIILEDLRACEVERPTWKKACWYYFAHPEFKLVVHYRWILALHPKGGVSKFIAKFLWLRAVKHYGCYLSPTAKIGKGLRFPHVTGIVIGYGAVIGDNVTLYQNVTLGQKEKQYPTIKNGAIIYPGACVVGAVTVGENTMIGPNSTVIRDVADNSAVAGVPAKELKKP